MFAHRSIDGFMMWGFWEGRHWRPSAAMYRRDWSIKPNGEAYRDLVLNKWWTDATAQTAEDGAVSLRGFKGTYDIEVTAGDFAKTASARLDADGLDLTVTLR